MRDVFGVFARTMPFFQRLIDDQSYELMMAEMARLKRLEVAQSPATNPSPPSKLIEQHYRLKSAMGEPTYQYATPVPVTPSPTKGTARFQYVVPPPPPPPNKPPALKLRLPTKAGGLNKYCWLCLGLGGFGF